MFQETFTHCGFCSVGCAFGLDESGRAEGFEHPVNLGKLCILGKSSPALLSNAQRLTSPLIRVDGQTIPTDYVNAIRHIAGRLKNIPRDSVAVYGGGSLSNEAAYLLGKFARIVLKTPNVDYNGRYCMSSASLAQKMSFGADLGLGKPMSDLTKYELIVLVGTNPAETLPIMMHYLREAKRKGTRFVVIDPRHTLTVKQLDALHMSIKPGTDIALANSLLNMLYSNGKANLPFIMEKTVGFDKAFEAVKGCSVSWASLHTGLPKENILRLFDLLISSKRSLILTGRGCDQWPWGTKTVLSFINLSLALGADFGALTGQANGMGVREMGIKPDQLPGDRSLHSLEDLNHIARVWDVKPSHIPQKSGMTAYEILQGIGEGKIRCLFVVGSNPVASSPCANRVREYLKGLDLLVVVDSFLSETTRLAHVVLPSALWYEEWGTVTNLEGRVLLRRPLREPPEGVKSDVEIIKLLAHALGYAEKFPYEKAEEVFEEIRLATKGAKADYSGITYESLSSEGSIFRPCPSETPRQLENTFYHKAKFVPTPWEPTYPQGHFVLITGRVLQHYLTGNLTHRIPMLHAKLPQALVEINPEDANILDLKEGERVVLKNRFSSLKCDIKLSSDVPKGVVFMPIHFQGEGCVNNLLPPKLDPISKIPQLKGVSVEVEKCTE